MYCYNCGKFFPEEDIVREFDWDTGPMYCCPFCGADDIGDTEECSICGEEFVEGEISHGFCLSCLWDSIDYDITLDYIKERGLLADFVLTYIMDAGKIEHSSVELDTHLEETFRRMVADDKLCAKFGDNPRFLESCKFYCLPYYQNGDFGIEGQEFAEWYADRLRKEKKA